MPEIAGVQLPAVLAEWGLIAWLSDFPLERRHRVELVRRGPGGVYLSILRRFDVGPLSTEQLADVHVWAAQFIDELRRRED